MNDRNNKNLRNSGRLEKISKIFARLKRVTPSILKSWMVIHFVDAFLEKRITGYDLTKTIACPDTLAKKGTTDSQPARYLIIDKVFSHVSLTSEDSFIDVGCGQGRVLAFLIKNHYPCSIYGVELSEEPGKVVTDWTKNYPSIHVILCDAFYT